MNYIQAEADIVARLQPFSVANIDVKSLPEKQSDFERPYERALITVSYKGSKWDKPRSTSHISQEEEVMFQFNIESRHLRGPLGVYTIKQALIVALVGFRPTDLDKMYCHESGIPLVSEVLKDDVWTYTLIMCGKNITVEDFEEDLSTILTQLTMNDETTGNTYTIPAAP